MQLTQMDFEAIVQERDRRIEELRRTNMRAANARFEQPHRQLSKEFSLFRRLNLKPRWRGRTASTTESHPVGA